MCIDIKENTINTIHMHNKSPENQCIFDKVVSFFSVFKNCYTDLFPLLFYCFIIIIMVCVSDH